MWLALAFLSAFLLGCYEVNKKMSLNGNAVIPVLFFNTLISSLIFVPFILLSFYTDCLDGTMVYVPRASLEDHVKVLPEVSLSVRDESLSYCLKRLFSPLPIIYRVTGQYIILKRKPRQYTISGFVRDSASYESLLGASVLVKSSRGGTMSNNYGFYSLILPPGKVRLRASYVGFKAMEIGRYSGDPASLRDIE